MMAEYYIVWNSGRTEGFVTDDASDADKCATGQHDGIESTAGAAFRETYEDDVPLVTEAVNISRAYEPGPGFPSRLEIARAALIQAAQDYEDATHQNETEMDACVDDAESNRLATQLRERAVALNADVKSLLIVNREQS